MNKTTIQTKSHVDAKWYVVDAAQETLGRLAVECARRLMGKHKPTYTPHVDTGDYMVVINAATVQVTGTNKESDKMYRHHTGWPGGLKELSLERMRERRPEDIVRLAVRRMLPKTTLGRHMLKKLKVYAGDRHSHHAQKPEPISFGTGR